MGPNCSLISSGDPAATTLPSAGRGAAASPYCQMLLPLFLLFDSAKRHTGQAPAERRHGGRKPSVDSRAGSDSAGSTLTARSDPLPPGLGTMPGTGTPAGNISHQVVRKCY